MGMTEFLNMIKQKNGSQSESDENADNVDDRDFYFTGGTYSVSQVKVEYSGYGSRVKFRVHGGYDPASTGTSVARNLKPYSTEAEATASSPSVTRRSLRSTASLSRT